MTTFYHLLLLHPDLLPYPLKHLCQLHLNLLPRLGVLIMLHALAAHVSRREAALVEMVVDLVNAPAAGFFTSPSATFITTGLGKKYSVFQKP